MKAAKSAKNAIEQAQRDAVKARQQQNIKWTNRVSIPAFIGRLAIKEMQLLTFSVSIVCLGLP